MRLQHSLPGLLRYQASSRQSIREGEIPTVRMGCYLLHVCSRINPEGHNQRARWPVKTPRP